MTTTSALDGRRFPGWLVILGAITAIGPLSIDMYLPAFPAMERNLGSPAGGAELTLAGFFIGMALGQLFWGPLSDRFGRKPPLYWGLALYALASLGCALAGNVATLIFWRILQALGGSAGMTIARAVVRDRCGARDAARAFSMLILIMGLAPILAPLLGGWVVTTLGWRAIFFLLVAFALAILTALHFGLTESHDTRHEPPLQMMQVMRNYAGLFASRLFIGYSLSGGLAMAGMFAYIAGSPFVLIQLGGIAPEHFGWAFGANAFGFIAASQLNAHLLKTHAPTRLLRHALWMPALAGLILTALAFTGKASLLPTLLCLFLYVASLGFIVPNASACALATQGQQAGTASALMGALQFGLATLAGAAVGHWHDGSARPLALVLALCGVGAWLLYRLQVHRHDRQGKQK